MICGFGSVKMRIERNGEIVATLQGLPNHEKATRRAYIGFEPGSDIQIGDVVINPANERFHIINVRNSFVNDRAIQIKAYSLSETEYTQSREKHETAVYNIGNAYGSVIGNSSNATINYQMGFQEMRERAAFENTPDREQVEKLISLVEMMVNGEVPAQKGLLSRFSETMEKHSWLTSSISSLLLSWLTQLPH